MALIKYVIDYTELSPEEYESLNRFLDGLNFIWQPDIRNPRTGILHIDENTDITSLNLPEKCHYSRLQ